MLSDPKLEVSDRLSLRNERALTPSGPGSTIIPTTFLVDAEGTLRWIDQTDDYMLRSAPDRVLGAIEAALG